MRYILVILWLLTLCLGECSYAVAAPSKPEPEYGLSVFFDIPNSRIRGVAKIALPDQRKRLFHTASLSIRDVTLNGVKTAFSKRGDVLIITPPESGTLEIVYDGAFPAAGIRNAPGESADNIISEHAISLTGDWYPRPEGLTTYRLSAFFPGSFQAVSEADHIEPAANGGVVFFFDHPVDRLTLVASDGYNVVEEKFGDISLYAYFFKEEAGLAKQYIEYAKKYLTLYTEMIGPYPYRRFSIVENVLPTGYSMPTFTLLGRDIVRLPFIVETSLGHEILHQWFGNSVYINFDKGNWAEGLTTYMADYYYEEQKGNGTDYRKQVLIDYQSYVDKDNVFPLRAFLGRTDSSSKAVGYGKAAMLFHMLKKRVGDDRFQQALRDFVERNSFRKASWDDIRSSFEKASGTGLGDFFAQWLDRTPIAELEAGSAIVRQSVDGYKIMFELRQKNKPFTLVVPVTVYAAGQKETLPSHVDKTKNDISLYSRELPDRVVIDEDYDIMRRLSHEEFPPVIARLLGDKGTVLVLPTSKKDAYEEVIDDFRKKGASIKENSEISDASLHDHSFIILGNDNPMLARFRGFVRTDTASGGFITAVSESPLNHDKVILFINSASKHEADAAFQKIFHYGKYSRLAFNMGNNILKETAPSKRGLLVNLEEEAPAVHVPDIKNLSQVIDSVSDKQIVYVGEEHVNYSHHAVQLEVIKGLLQKERKIAIGMEMFQRPYQSVLDDYISGTIDQKTFLKKSQYFARWGFDYDLYKPIIDFARENRIPLIALNIDREIVERVSKSGVDSLPPEMKTKVPAGMDFSDERYRQRLKKVFEGHESIKDRNFDFFFEAQVLWDETMSQTVTDYLAAHPDYRIVVIAGSGHLTYGSGIPKRAFRRNGLGYAVILSDGEMDEGIADYIVFPRNIEGPKPARMMVMLGEEKGKLLITGFPENSISQKAGLEQGDIIRSLDDIPVSAIDDVKIFLLEKQIGDRISVKILRKTGGVEREMLFSVTL
jgi:aminopeptidase N